MKLTTALCVMILFSGLAAAQEPQPSPPSIREEVVVTANRTETKIGDTPASIVAFSRRDITTSAAPTIDDILRQAVGFSIFRRSSSRNANPTTQGVSLRGVGASGASRSVVLFDGVPLNDPFGGWVQWNRVAPVAAESVEVLRGGASSLYGDTSLSGAVNVIPRKADDKYLFSGDIFGGTQNTISGSGLFGFTAGDWLGTVDGTLFQTKGYIPVDEAVRGPVDSFAGVRSSNYSGKFTRKFGERASIFLRPSLFGEVRTNGTGLQTNRTHIRQLAAGGDINFGLSKNTKINWRVYGGTQVFDQVSSSVNTPRTSETLSRIQRVPVQNIGASFQFSTVYKNQVFVGGIETRNVRGSSDEIGYTNGLATSKVGSGGRQNNVGAFFQDLLRIGNKLIVSGSVRLDGWQNYAALSTTLTLATNQRTTVQFPDREEKSVSPQFSILYHLTDRFSFYANASRSYRAPTLNDLYRSFRVGNVLTLANENLLAEHANNFEGGISIAGKHSYLRASGFWTEVERPVANVTLTSTPALITRQRQNAGSTRSSGLEIEGETNIRLFGFSAGYMFVEPIVHSFPSNPALEGLLIPQVARHQVTFRASYSPAKWIFTLQGRASSEQFDDDQNLFRLEPYTQIDLFFSRRLNEKLHIYVGVENIFNSRYSVGKTPIRTVSSPTNMRIGLRWN
ncbi:MAG TPA: TonB-dependent receptor [Pyrinomonadaceae bacterium]|nr:TonB-dependent receptor [Pyrinomonadaceae bacterium]